MTFCKATRYSLFDYRRNKITIFNITKREHHSGLTLKIKENYNAWLVRHSYNYNDLFLVDFQLGEVITIETYDKTYFK